MTDKHDLMSPLHNAKIQILEKFSWISLSVVGSRGPVTGPSQ